MPVPPCTTLTIMSSISFAFTGPTARLRRSRRVRETVFPCGETTLSTTHGRITIPALPIPPATIAICIGVTSMPLLPERHPARVDVLVALRVPEVVVAIQAARVALASGVSSGGRS